jgi:hypothetical protein
MTTALLHGRSRSWVDGRRHWPFLLAGVLATGLIAAGLGIAEAYQEQKAVDAHQDDIAPPTPIETSEPAATPTDTPTSPPPSSSPSASPTPPKASTPATKRPTTPEPLPARRPPSDQHRHTKADPRKPTTTKPRTDRGGTNEGGSQQDGNKGRPTPENGGSKNR